MAYILNLRGEHENCEAEIFSLIKKFPSYSYWIGKSLILLADNYVAKEDLFQAKVTLKNVIDNSKFPELVNTANEKLEIIEKQEAPEEVKEEEPVLDLDLLNDKDLEKLFNEKEEIIEEELPKLDKEKDIEIEDTPIDE